MNRTQSAASTGFVYVVYGAAAGLAILITWVSAEEFFKRIPWSETIRACFGMTGSPGPLRWLLVAVAVCAVLALLGWVMRCWLWPYLRKRRPAFWSCSMLRALCLVAAVLVPRQSFGQLDSAIDARGFSHQTLHFKVSFFRGKSREVMPANWRPINWTTNRGLLGPALIKGG